MFKLSKIKEVKEAIEKFDYEWYLYDNALEEWQGENDIVQEDLESFAWKRFTFFRDIKINKLNVSGIVDILLKKSNYDFSKFKIENKLKSFGICDNCNKLTEIDIHHIKPRWVFAIEEIIKLNPKVFADVEKITKMALKREIHIKQANDLNNLCYLCYGCHRKIEIKTARYWRNELIVRYNK